ncbi:MAG: hypothetical protein V4610_16270 [Pseudomonadota bacterium]|jgi:hypothetical protein|uniref:Metallo-beta-lactamase domain-containing protein n=1 Tax=hydrothermal vent metagenome TaxID=652676 RepID=A0A160TJK3_9ZZZZ
MEHFTLEPLAARHGDCLLLHYGPAAAPGTILIDGGPSQVYGKTLKPRLKTLKAKRPGGAFAIDLLVVSHIDDDHIRGIIDFTEDWRDAKTDHRPWDWPVRQLWHNSFERIAGGNPNDVRASVLASFGTQNFSDIAGLDTDNENEHAAFKILASVGQGTQLRNDAKLLDIPTNQGFDGLVQPPADPGEPVPFGDQLRLHVVGPLPDQLKALRDKFAQELPKGPAASLAAYSDTSIPNLSSIVLLAKYRDKSMLLTGDARGDYILTGLGNAGLLDQGRLHVDILKMQHHGSDRNTAGEFFERVTADHYVASASGKYENPDRATFEMLVRARPKDDRYTIHLTGEVADIDVLRAKERATTRDQQARDNKPLSPQWDDATDSLAAFFSRATQDGYKFTVQTPALHPAPIDLLDPIGF